MKAITGKEKSLIGMVHVAALPGTPRAEFRPALIINQAKEEARLLEDAGFDAIMIENMHDIPYLKRNVGPEITATMTAVASALREAISLPIGIQILAGANKEALAAAHASGAQFIRAEGFVFGHVADEGFMESDAGELMRYRRNIGAERVLVLTDIKKKHSSHAITSDVSLVETAHAAEFFGSDGLIITGTATGKPTHPEDLRQCREGSDLPCLVGSGATPETLKGLLPHCDGTILGSWMKVEGDWRRPVDRSRAVKFASVFKELCQSD